MRIACIRKVCKYYKNIFAKLWISQYDDKTGKQLSKRHTTIEKERFYKSWGYFDIKLQEHLQCSLDETW